MDVNDILKLPSTPLVTPSYSKAPYRFLNREYLIIAYESDPDTIRAQLPKPLEPDGTNLVFFEFTKMPDNSELGSYTKGGILIPALYNGEKVNFTSQMYINTESPVSNSDEIWGFSRKIAHPVLYNKGGSLKGKIHFDGAHIATGTMRYKQDKISYEHGGETACTSNAETLARNMAKTRVNLKLVPDVDGSLLVAQLVAYNMTEVIIKNGWSGPAQLYLVPNEEAPVADLPVKKVIGGMHFVADMTLPYGRVLHDYIKEGSSLQKVA